MKSKQTEIKEVSAETKRVVMERQHFCSIGKQTLFQNAVEFHHVISRGRQGVGYEWNIVALTPQEHRAYHDGNNIKVNGRDRYTPQEFETLMKNHLKMNYEGWTEEKCKYHKGWEEEDYGIRRTNGKL